MLAQFAGAGDQLHFLLRLIQQENLRVIDLFVVAVDIVDRLFQGLGQRPAAAIDLADLGRDLSQTKLLADQLHRTFFTAQAGDTHKEIDDTCRKHDENQPDEQLKAQCRPRQFFQRQLAAARQTKNQSHQGKPGPQQQPIAAHQQPGQQDGCHQRHAARDQCKTHGGHPQVRAHGPRKDQAECRQIDPTSTV